MLLFMKFAILLSTDNFFVGKFSDYAEMKRNQH